MSNRGITPEDLCQLRLVGDPQISPDGERVAFTLKTVDSEKNRYQTHLWMADTAGGQTRQFTYGEGPDSAPRWSPDGSAIAFLRTVDQQIQIWAIPSDGGEARQVTRLAEGDVGAPVWSPDGTRLAFTYQPTHADWTQDAGKEREKKHASSPPKVITRLRYRMDGEGYLQGRTHIWTCDSQTGEAVQLTDGEFDDRSPAWSPDGAQIAFISNRCDDPDARPYQIDLWLVDAEGDEPREIPAPIGYKGGPSWSPDGNRIAYLGQESGDDPWEPRFSRLWVADLGSDQATCLTRALDRTLGDETISDAIESGNTTPIWSTDGGTLYFVVSDRGSCHLYGVSSDGQGQPATLIDGDLEVAGFTFSQDSQRFALLVGTQIQPAEVFTAIAPSPTELKPLTHMNSDFLSQATISQPEEVWFKESDGTDLQGWIMKPTDFDSQQKYPLLLYIHGGPEAQYGNAFFHEFQTHAARGYVLLYTNPRGSTGYSEEFSACIRGNWGGLDYQDVMAAADYAETLPYVDSSRMAVAGGSYGGFMTNWIIGNTDRFACAVTERSVSNMVADFGTVDLPEAVDGFWKGNAWDRPDTLWQQSPLRFVENIHTPVLIIHSEGDLRCPIHHAEQLYVALKLLKRETVFVRYPPETSHGMSRNGPPDLRIDRLHRISDWLDQHLKANEKDD
ncbi:MAG: S9 family peptidase [SAR202 cluster bacterium]|nr:S9 family peptidase [SAR202 cluster bacterium]MDP6713111.1 S9 family peptidase [SAR202 cluster bacterium]